MQKRIHSLKDQSMFWIKLPYFLGIGADALWTVGLLSPTVFGVLTGNPCFYPDLQTRLIMGIGGSLMAGWTALLIWAVRAPIERHVVILITAFPVVSGILCVSLVGYIAGNGSCPWILGKTAVLLLTMTISFVLSRRIARKRSS